MGFHRDLFVCLFVFYFGAEVPSLSPNQSHVSLTGLAAEAAAAAAGGGAQPTSLPAASGKNRSHSTTSLSHPSGKRLVRERKTVCSLHPMNGAATPAAPATRSCAPTTRSPT